MRWGNLNIQVPHEKQILLSAILEEIKNRNHLCEAR
jgi:hypothetical protein